MSDQRTRVLYRLLSRLGARLGNWNDRVNGDIGTPRAEHPRRWHVLDSIAGRLYVLGDRKRVPVTDKKDK